jgi:MFS family permease
VPPAALRPLRHRNFALTFSAGMVSNAGSWMAQVAVGAFVTDQTGQFAWTGLIAAAAFLPMGVLAPVGGALADRYDRRRFLMIGNTFEGVMATALALLVAAGEATPGRVSVLVFITGCSTGLRLPFLQAMLPDLVPRDDILPAASLGAAQYNMGRVFGPALAAIVIAGLGYQWAFGINAASFGAVILALALVRLPPHETTADTDGLWTRIREGARVARNEPGCRSAIILIGFAAFLVAPFIGLIPAKALALTGGGKDEMARAIGSLTVAQGVGAVFGALTIPSLAERFGRRRVLVIDLIATPLALIAYAATAELALAVVAMAVVGSVYIGVLSGLQAQVQLRAPLEYRGRVLSLHMVSLGTLYPIGALVQGAVADGIGLAWTTTAGALALLAVLAVIATTRRGMFEALADLPVDLSGDGARAGAAAPPSGSSTAPQVTSRPT